MKKKLIAAAIALIMALTCLPISAAAAKASIPAEKASITSVEQYWTVPSGCNEHDYNKCAAFLEQTDEDGLKNGTKLNADYNVNDPTTWTGFAWTDSTERRIVNISLNDAGQYGPADFSGCAALERFISSYNQLSEADFSGCTALKRIYCSDSGLTEVDAAGCTALETVSLYTNVSLTALDVSNCTALQELICTESALTALNVSGCTALQVLACSFNALTELDVSDCAALVSLDCSNNALTVLDLSNNPNLPLDGLLAMGRGRIGYCSGSGGVCTVFAYPEETSVFIGWYNSSGELLSEDAEFNVTGTDGTELIARFRDSVHTVTFVDWDGTVLSEQQVDDGGAAEAPEVPARVGYDFVGWDVDFDNVIADLTVTALYEESGLEPTIPGDVNCDGVVNSSDALMVMRCSMNLLALDEQGLRNGDVNGDGSVNATDALLIMRTALAG